LKLVNKKRSYTEAAMSNPTDQIYSVTTLMLQSFFPPIDVAKIKTKNLKRVIIFYLEPKTDVIEFRHYAIR